MRLSRYATQERQESKGRRGEHQDRDGARQDYDEDGWFPAKACQGEGKEQGQAPEVTRSTLHPMLTDPELAHLPFIQYIEPAVMPSLQIDTEWIADAYTQY